MKGDFSRLSFDPRKHYAGVLQQQGRAGLDSDWNEWVEIVLRRLAIETRDVIGGCGRPKHAPGFEISVDSTITPPDLLISDGRLYAGGMLVETHSVARYGTRFSQQIDWPFPDQSTWTALFPSGPVWPGLDFTSLGRRGTMRQLIYAEVWMRHITALNDEAARDEAFTDASGHPDWTKRPEVGDLIRERGLGGPDTCTRLQTVAQVKHWDNLDPKIQTCDQACRALDKALPPKTIGTMQLDVTPTPPVTDPCQEPLQGGYGGAWNRTYRVEIHDDGPAGTATFKWSTENGAFAVRVKGTALTNAAAGSDIIITSIGNDQETELSANDWVEVSGEETELGLFRNALAQVKTAPVANVDGTWTIQLTGPAVIPSAPFLRRWSANTRTIQLNQQFNLDAGSGLGITFFDAAGATGGTTYFHAQDYWTWSAREDIRAVEPETLAHVPQPPQGIERHYCCLALLSWQHNGATIVNTSNTRCTPVFPPLTEIPTDECGCCCVISVGDGRLSHGDFDSITQAFANLPDTGTRGAIVVCIGEGTHRIDDPIWLVQDRIIIRGCGPNTFIEAPAGAFVLDSRRHITFADLVIESQTAPAITTYDVRELTIRDSRIRMSLSHVTQRPPLQLESGRHQLVPSSPALVLSGWLIDVLRNEIRGSATGGGIAVMPGSGEVSIDRNNIHKSARAGVDFSYGFEPAPSEWIAFRLGTGGAAFESIRISNNTFTEINAPAIRQVATVSGMQLLSKTSEAAPQSAKTKKPAAPFEILKMDTLAPSVIADITIEGNLITRCGVGSTIELRGEPESAQKTAAKLAALQEASASDPEAAILLYAVERLDMSRNRIVRNGQRSPIYAGLFVKISEGVVIRENVISENGRLIKTASTNSGGVILRLALPELAKQRHESVSDAEGWASVVVEDNLIDSLNGSALRIVGAGPMRVRGNTLTNRHISASAFDACLVMMNFGTADEAQMPAGLADALLYAVGGSRILPPSLLTAVGGLTMIADNQIVTLSEVKSNGAAVFVSSGDDLSLTNNQVRVKGQNSIVVNTIADAYTLRVTGNRFSEGLTIAEVSCMGEGSFVTGTSNQATHCLIFQGDLGTATDSNIVQLEARCRSLGDQLLSRQASVTRELAPVVKNVTALRQQMTTLQLSSMNEAQTTLTERATALTQVPKGAKVPATLQYRATLYKNLATPLNDTRLATTQAPKASDDTFVIHGRVLNAAGDPQASLTVSLSDAKGVANRATPVKTDANGYYTITLRTAEFPDLTADKSQLFVAVADSKQREIAKPTTAITFQPGKIAVMPIES